MLSPGRTGSTAPVPQVELLQALVCLPVCTRGLGGWCFKRPWAALTLPQPCSSRAALEKPVFILWDIPVRWEAWTPLPAPWLVCASLTGWSRCRQHPGSARTEQRYWVPQFSLGEGNRASRKAGMALFLPVSAGLHGCSLAFPSQSFLRRATRWKHFPKTRAMTPERGGNLPLT